jgi:hypothetical protein
VRLVFRELGEQEGLIHLLTALSEEAGFDVDKWYAAFKAEQQRLREEALNG